MTKNVLFNVVRTLNQCHHRRCCNVLTSFNKISYGHRRRSYAMQHALRTKTEVASMCKDCGWHLFWICRNGWSGWRYGGTGALARWTKKYVWNLRTIPDLRIYNDSWRDCKRSCFVLVSITWFSYNQCVIFHDLSKWTGIWSTSFSRWSLPHVL